MNPGNIPGYAAMIVVNDDDGNTTSDVAAALTLTLSLDKERDRNWTGRRKSKIHRLTFISLVSLDRARCVRFSVPRWRCPDR